MQEQEFLIEVSHAANVLLLRVHGELDMLTAPELTAAMQPPDGAGVVVDLSDCSFIDSGGLRVLLNSATTHATKIVCPPGNVRRVLQIVDAKRFAPIYDSLEEVLLPDEQAEAVGVSVLRTDRCRSIGRDRFLLSTYRLTKRKVRSWVSESV
jgi:anti-anti-sigma factor